MSRVLVLGQCPLPFEEVNRLYAPGLRTWQLAKALLDDGHEVALACDRIPFTYEDEAAPPDWSEGNLTGYRLDEATFKNGRLVQQIHDTFRPDCLVAANRLPALVAVRLKTDKPVWADINGHSMGEAQVKAHRYDDDIYLSYFWKEEKEILERADVFSAVSSPQRFALIGELGALGRLNKLSTGYEFVYTIPNAAPVAGGQRSEKPALRGSTVPSNGFVVLWSGGYNTWTDVETLFAGLSQAMRQEPRIFFVSIGGAIDGHDEISYGRFLDLIAQSDLRSRFVLRGWVPTSEVVSYLAESDVAINIDALTYEGLLGARTRMLDWMQAGLPILTTVTCELTEILARERLAFTFGHADADNLAGQLLRLSAMPEALRQRGLAAKEYARRHFTYAETTRALRSWVHQPAFAPDRRRRIDFLHTDDAPGRAPPERASPPKPRGLWGRLRQPAESAGPFPKVRFLSHEIPEEMQVGRTYRVKLRLLFQSVPAYSDEAGALNLSYHWHLDGVEVIHDGLRTPLRASAAGEKAEILAWVKAPPEAGEYLLQWDLVREGLAWMNTNPSEGLTAVVRVLPKG